MYNYKNYQLLYKSVILQAFTDIVTSTKKGNGNQVRAIQFVNSDYFAYICDLAGIEDVEKFKNILNQKYKEQTNKQKK